MFSKEFMSFLATYGEEKNLATEKETTKEIVFKNNCVAKLAYVTVVVKNNC